MRILGVRLDPLTPEAALELIEERLCAEAGELTIVSTINAECLALASQDHAYHEVLNQASLNLADGVGVTIAARLRGGRLHRLQGSRLVYEIAALCSSRGKRLFLLGAGPRSARLACERLRALYDGLEVESYSPAFGASIQKAEQSKIEERLRDFAPQALCVALGMPRQEMWIHQCRSVLAGAGVRVVVGVGGAVDYVAGSVRQPPSWVRNAGLEWLYRLALQPRLRWRRQLTRLPRFAALAGLEAVRLRFRRTDGEE